MKNYQVGKNENKQYMLLLILCVILICCKKDISNHLIEFDLEADFPMETLDIQNIAEVKYLVLESSDDYLFTYFEAISNSLVICKNNVDKSYLFFDQTTGKPLSKVNRYGSGPEEYVSPVVSVYSEEKDELFILDYPAGIKVYSKDGTYKRKLTFREKSYPGGQHALYDFDANNLLFNDAFQGSSINNYPTAFILMSKEDGHTTEEMEIPYEKKVNYIMLQGALGVMPGTYHAVRNGRDYLLTDYSSDTVYRFTPERELIPVLVRKPSIQAMEVKILLHSWQETSKYLFFTTESLEYNEKELKGFPTKGYLMEKDSGKFFQTNILMKDYEGKQLILGPPVLSNSADEQTGVIKLSVTELMKANEEGKLSGKLKEITTTLTEDDEFVLMILKFK